MGPNPSSRDPRLRLGSRLLRSSAATSESIQRDGSVPNIYARPPSPSEHAIVLKRSRRCHWKQKSGFGVLQDGGSASPGGIKENRPNSGRNVASIAAETHPKGADQREEVKGGGAGFCRDLHAGARLIEIHAEVCGCGLAVGGSSRHVNEPSASWREERKKQERRRSNHIRLDDRSAN